MQRQKRMAAFTLFEILLVIAIIAVIASLGLMTYRRHAEQQKINRVALEMQQVLSAAMAFNTDNGATWPTAYDNSSCDSTTPPVDTDGFVANFLPNQSITSSFGSHFCWSQDSTGKRFWVALAFAPGEQTIAQRIANILPFGITTRDLTADNPASSPCDDANICYVRAEVVQPAAASMATSRNDVVGVGQCVHAAGANQPGSSHAVACDDDGISNNGNTQNYTIHVACDQAGQTGYALFVPSNYYMGYVPVQGSSNLYFSLGKLDVQTTTPCQETSPGDFTCHVNVSVAVGQDGTSGVAPDQMSPFNNHGYLDGSYIAYCRKEATTPKAQVMY